MEIQRRLLFPGAFAHEALPQVDDDEPDKKRFLNRTFGAHICDMETAGIVITAARAGVPCLVIKTVSDGVEGGAAEFEKELGRASAICIDIADKIVNETLK